MTAGTSPAAAAAPVYDVIGASYNTTRRADPRLEQVIWAALGGSNTVLNVGAGTGAYEPRDRCTVAVEPSATMRQARPLEAAPCLAARAESLPFDDASFDAVMAILTVHHWSDYRAGLAELRRVARHRVLILHWDQKVIDQLWLARYFPEASAFDRHRSPSLDDVRARLGPGTRAIPLLVPHDCQDGFGGAYWRRPHAYLDPAVRGRHIDARPDRAPARRRPQPAAPRPRRRHMGHPESQPGRPARTRLRLPADHRRGQPVTSAETPVDALDRVLRRACRVLIDFDGPVCLLFTGISTEPVAAPLRPSRTPPVPPSPRRSGNPATGPGSSPSPPPVRRFPETSNPKPAAPGAIAAHTAEPRTSAGSGVGRTP
jgi:hypothetical protein